MLLKYTLNQKMTSKKGLPIPLKVLGIWCYTMYYLSKFWSGFFFLHPAMGHQVVKHFTWTERHKNTWARIFLQQWHTNIIIHYMTKWAIFISCCRCFCLLSNVFWSTVPEKIRQTKPNCLWTVSYWQRSLSSKSEWSLKLLLVVVVVIGF